MVGGAGGLEAVTSPGAVEGPLGGDTEQHSRGGELPEEQPVYSEMSTVGEQEDH